MLLISFLFIFSLVQTSKAQPIQIQLCTPESIQEGNKGYLIMKAVNGTGMPLTGMAENISCYIEYPDGTMFVNVAHPWEIEPGAYCLEFQSDVEGTYVCWVVMNSSGVKTMDAGLFQINTDVTDNATSKLSKRIGEEYSLGKIDRYSTEQQLSYLLVLQKEKAQNITRNAEKSSFISSLGNTAIGQALQTVFFFIIFTLISTSGTTVVLHRFDRRSKRR